MGKAEIWSRLGRTPPNTKNLNESVKMELKKES